MRNTIRIAGFDCDIAMDDQDIEELYHDAIARCDESLAALCKAAIDGDEDAAAECWFIVVDAQRDDDDYDIGYTDEECYV